MVHVRKFTKSLKSNILVEIFQPWSLVTPTFDLPSCDVILYSAPADMLNQNKHQVSFRLQISAPLLATAASYKEAQITTCALNHNRCKPYAPKWQNQALFWPMRYSLISSQMLLERQVKFSFSFLPSFWYLAFPRFQKTLMQIYRKACLLWILNFLFRNVIQYLTSLASLFYTFPNSLISHKSELTFLTSISF